MSRLGNVGGRLYRGEGLVRLRRPAEAVVPDLWRDPGDHIAALVIFRLQSAWIQRRLGFTFKAPAGHLSTGLEHVTTPAAETTLTVQQVNGTSWQVQTEVLSQLKQFKVQNAIADSSWAQNQLQAGELQSVGRAGQPISLKALEALLPSSL